MKRFGQAVSQLSQAAWRRGMSQKQGGVMLKSLDRAVPTIQALLSLVVSIDVRGVLATGVDPTKLLVAMRSGLEAAAIYCELAGMLGAPATLLVEEANAQVVQCLKHVVKQLVAPLLNSFEKTSDDPLPFGREDTTLICQAVGATMGAVHELLCRHKFADEQLHQLIHLAMSVFFFVEPDFRLCAAAEEVLVTIFCRHPSLSSSVFQEFLVGVTKLPTGKASKKFLLPVPPDNPDHGLSTWTHLVLRLVQSTCLPLQETLGGKIDFEMVSQRRSAAQTTLSQLASGLVQRLLLTNSRNDDLRSIFSGLTDEFLFVCWKPAWPGALAMIRTCFYQLVSLVQQGRKKDLADASLREFALKTIASTVANFSHHQVKVAEQRIKLPSWNEPKRQEIKETRTLQEVALRLSLQDGRKLPWTAAAKAVQAWDAEVYLSKNDDGAGLTNLTDDIVFRYIIMAQLEDERTVAAKCPPAAALGRSTVGAAVFQAAHPVHAWSFLVCDWAEAAVKTKRQLEAREEEVGEVDLEANHRQKVLERFLAISWTSPTILSGEGRRLMLPYIVHKAYRQLQCGIGIESLLKIGIDCFVMQANSQQATLRKTAVKCLGEAIETDRRVLAQKAVEETLDMRIRDESAWVRQAALDLLGRLLDTSDEDEDDKDDKEGMLVGASGADSALSDILARFQKTVRSRINDTSVLVRRQASKILGAFVLSNPEHPDVVPVALDLLRRSSDAEKLRSMVLTTFELLWFANEEPTAISAQQLSRVLDACSGLSQGPAEILGELLERLKKNLNAKKRTKGYEHAIGRWTSLLLEQFVHLNGDARLAVMKQRSKEIGGEEERWIRRRALLSSLEAFAIVQPCEMLPQIRPLTVYLNLDDSSTAEEQWVAQKVCRIISAVLPCPVDKKGLLEHATVQADLQALIKSQPSTGVREAVRALCSVIKHVTGDLRQVVKHLIEAILAVSHYGVDYSAKLDKITLLYVSRLLWIGCSILETLPLDNYMEPHGNRLKRDVFPFPLADGTVAATMLVALSKMFEIPDNAIKAVVVQCLGFFLCGHRSNIKERSVGHMLAYSLKNSDLTLRLKALETMSCLLAHYAKEAEKETQAGATASSVSAVESAQPLAIHSGDVLAHLSVDKIDIGKLIVHRTSDGKDSEMVAKIRIEALSVTKYLHQQGLVNPMTILPKVFTLAFSLDSSLSELACLLLKEITETRPSILLNRIDEAMHDVFLSALASSQPPHLGEALQTPCAAFCELYADVFRRTKGSRESILRKMLQQVFRLQASRFNDVFDDLLECSEHPAMSFKKKRLNLSRTSDEDVTGFEANVLKQMPPLQYYQLLYAQFVTSIITALPFQYESEPLLVIYECNRHLSLNGGVLVGADDLAMSNPNKENGKDYFAEAASIVTCLVLKRAMKAEYGLSAEQCVQFNPKDVKQEKLKGGWFDRCKTGAAGEDDAPKNRTPFFPVDEWSRLASPIAANYQQPSEISRLVSEAMDNDPWDSNFSRYKARLDQLEGRPPEKRARPKDAPTPRTGKVALDATPRSGKSARAGRGTAASAGRGRGRGRGLKRKRSEPQDLADERDEAPAECVVDSDEEADEDYVPA
jgi:hypothetical protein